jgi:hypothetical protein
MIFFGIDKTGGIAQRVKRILLPFFFFFWVGHWMSYVAPKGGVLAHTAASGLFSDDKK